MHMTQEKISLLFQLEARSFGQANNRIEDLYKEYYKCDYLNDFLMETMETFHKSNKDTYEMIQRNFDEQDFIFYRNGHEEI